jgi:glycosyltransferase involved in cell wall biosynthesis
MRSPLVSVIIPTYNRSSLICKTVENVLRQTYQKLEVIVVDDGSTDDSLERLRVFGSRIRVITQENGGPSAARNKGLEVASGEIIAFQDSDDEWLPTKLERQVSILDRAGKEVPCCICNATMHFRGKPPITSFNLAFIHPALPEGIWSNVAEVLSSTFILFNQCAAIRSDALRRVGGFDESLRFMEDYDLSLRLLSEGNSWAFISDPLVVWRQGSPDSLWEKAMGQQVSIHEQALRCLQSFADKLGGRDQFTGVRHILRREVKRRKRELLAARISQMDMVGASAIGALFKNLEHYRKAVYRRTPWYPSMRVAALNG